MEVEPAQHDVVAYLEAQNQELTAEVVDLRERLALATEHWSNDAYQTLEKVNKTHRQELATLRGDLHSKQSNFEAIKRRLGPVSAARYLSVALAALVMTCWQRNTAQRESNP